MTVGVGVVVSVMAALVGVLASPTRVAAQDEPAQPDPRPAQPDPPPAQPPQPQAQAQPGRDDDARRHFEDGRVAFAAGRFAEALVYFRASYRLSARPVLLFNIGSAADRQRLDAEALDAYERYLAAMPEAENRTWVEGRIAALRPAVERTRELDQARAALAGLERAREEVERAQSLFLAERFPEAADAFEQAYERQPIGAFLFNAAMACERARSPQRAADLLARYLEATPTARDADAVRARIDRLRTAQLDATAPVQTPSLRGLVSVVTRPADATVRILRGADRLGEGPAPFTHEVDEGEYAIVVEHPRHRTVSRPLRVRPGGIYTLIVEMSQGEFLGSLRIHTDVPGATVMLDDRETGPAGRTPFQTIISAGRHRLWLERPGYLPVEDEVAVGVGEEVTLRLELTRVPTGRIRVEADIRGARVFIDDRERGVVPWEGDVSAGPHFVRVEADGRKDWESVVQAPAGLVVPIEAELAESESYSDAFVTGGLALLSFAGAGVLMYLGGGLQDELVRDAQRGMLASDDPRIDRGELYYILADASLAVGGVFALLSFYFFIGDEGPDSEGRVRRARDWELMPTIDDSAAGGAATWRF